MVMVIVMELTRASRVERPNLRVKLSEPHKMTVRAEVGGYDKGDASGSGRHRGAVL